MTAVDEITVVEVWVDGPQGPPGTGVGLPVGGLEGQYAQKRSAATGDAGWEYIDAEDVRNLPRVHVGTSIDGAGTEDDPYRLAATTQAQIDDNQAQIAATRDEVAGGNESVAATLDELAESLSGPVGVDGGLAQ